MTMVKFNRASSVVLLFAAVSCANGAPVEHGPVANPNTGGVVSTTAPSFKMRTTHIDGGEDYFIPVGAPGHAQARLFKDDVQYAWPAGTTFEVHATSAKKCVYARAFGDITFLFAAYPCDEKVRFVASFPDGTKVEGTQVFHAFNDETPPTFDALIVADATVRPGENIQHRLTPFRKPPTLPVGATARIHIRANLAGLRGTNAVWITPEELSSVNISGGAITGTSSALLAVAPGNVTIKGAFSLPPADYPNAPSFEGLAEANVISPQPLTEIRAATAAYSAATISLNMTLGCVPHFAIGIYQNSEGNTYLNQYERLLKWSDVSTAIDLPFATASATGEFCPTRVGATIVTFTMGQVTSKQTIAVGSEFGWPTLRTEPSEIIIPTTASVRCTAFRVFAKAANEPEQDVTSNQAVTSFLEAKSTWAECHRTENALGLECCGSPKAEADSPRSPAKALVFYGIFSSATATVSEP